MKDIFRSKIFLVVFANVSLGIFVFTFFYFYPLISQKISNLPDRLNLLSVILSFVAILLSINTPFIQSFFKKNIKPKFVIDGKSEIKANLGIQDIFISIVNQGENKIEKNSLEYVCIIPKDIFYGATQGKYKHAMILSTGTHMTGTILVNVAKDSQPQYIFSLKVNLKEKREYVIKYYFKDENSVYYPKSVKLDSETNSIGGKFGEIKIKVF